MTPTDRPRLGAVLLTGGTSVRLDGVDKASLEIGGKTLLERGLEALTEAEDVVVVGAEVPTSRPVTFRREDPPGDGPAAGVLAGLDGFAGRPDLVVVLAVDMPWVTTDTVRRLRGAVAADGAQLVDGDGNRQHLCGIYRTSALLDRAASLGDEHGVSMRRLLAGLDLGEVPESEGESRDVDTWADVQAVREQFAD
ncbi:MAG: molybdenum cofactor guanylyltransferase [Actinomycetota bacterium]|nr:molybdenum cofactor guanylyltransferase [Actinomycetota bacterium]